METSATPGLVRSMRRWDLVGVVINGVIGSAIYGLPSVIAGKLGGALLQRLEQPGVGDGDDGLIRERLQQPGLTIREGLSRATSDHQRTDRRGFVGQRDAER